MKIAVAGTGYGGLSLAVLLSQNNEVTAVDIVPEKVEQIKNWQSPIQDEYIEKYLAEHEKRQLSLTATLDGPTAWLLKVTDIAWRAHECIIDMGRKSGLIFGFRFWLVLFNMFLEE